MARKKSTKAALAMLERHAGMMKHITEVLVLMRDRPENLQSWLKETPAEVYRGRAEGYNTAMEDVLHTENCYYGFQYLAEDCKSWTRPGEPEFAEWRRIYYGRE